MKDAQFQAELAYADHPSARVIIECAEGMYLPITKAPDGSEAFHQWARYIWAAHFHWESGEGERFEEQAALANAVCVS